MGVWEISMAFGASVHVRLVIVDIVLVERGEGQGLVRGKRAAHYSRLVRDGGLGS